MTLKSYNISIVGILNNDLPDDEEFIWVTHNKVTWIKQVEKDPITGKSTLWLHRMNGPAVMWNNGRTTWWVEGNRILGYPEFQEKTGYSDADILLYKIKYGEIS